MDKDTLRYKKILKNIFIYNGFKDAAENIPEIVKHCSSKVLRDKLELWKVWSDKSEWFSYADKISREDWYGKSSRKDKG
jgi:hypothetical protein